MEGMMKGKQTLISLSETRKNQNKQILLKLSFFLLIVLFVPFRIKIVVDGKMDKIKKPSTKLFTCLNFMLGLVQSIRINDSWNSVQFKHSVTHIRTTYNKFKLTCIELNPNSLQILLLQEI